MSLPRRFALRFALAAALAVAVALAGALAVFALRLEGMTETLSERFEAAMERRVRADGERLLGTVAEEIAPAMRDYDRMALGEVAMDGVFRRGAAAVRVYDGFGRALADGAGDPSAFERPAPPPLRGLEEPDTIRRWSEGETLWSGRAICDERECYGSVAVGMDASGVAAARREAEDALAEARRRFWIESAALGAGGVLLGAGLAALIGRRTGRRFAASIGSVAAALDRVAAGESGVTVETRDAELAVLADAVDRVASTIEQDRSGGAHAAIIEDMAEGLLLTDGDGVVTVANPAMHALFAAPPGALLGRSVDALFEMEPAAAPDALAPALSAVRRARRDDGTEFDVMVSARPSGSGAAAGVIAVAREAPAAAASDAKALEEARLRAEAAESAKSQFLAVMSHELRTPLNGILGGAAVLAGTDLDDRQRGLLGLVQNSGKSMLSLVSDLLDLSRTDAAAEADPGADFAPTDLEEIAHEIARGVAMDAARKDLDLYVRVDPGAPVVMTDGEKLVEIGGQFAENAVKFSDSGAVGVEIATRTREDGRVEVTLAVEDDGPGVPQAEREALFEAFRQGDASERRGAGGAGLGLSIAKKLGELLGGDIVVDDAEGGGASVSMRFIAERADADAPRTAPRLGAQRALVLEPNPKARAALRDQLASAGATVIEAGDAAAAAQVLREAEEQGRPLDLVVHPAEALDAAGASEFRDWIDGDGWQQGVASVALRAENAPLSTKDLPQRMQTVTRPPKLAELLLAAEAATRAAGRLKAAPDGGPAAAPAPAPEPEEPDLSVVEGGADTPVVLLADSNEVNRIVLSAWLEKAGFDCVSAADGQEALDLFRSRSPRLVLMDIGMPVMTGVEAAKAMRRHETSLGAAQAPIVGLVGKIRAGERERCSAAGMTDFLAKPVKTAELEAKLDRWTMLSKKPEVAAG